MALITSTSRARRLTSAARSADPPAWLALLRAFPSWEVPFAALCLPLAGIALLPPPVPAIRKLRRQPPLVGKTDVLMVPDNNVVKNPNANDLPGRDKAVSQGPVFRTRLRIPARVIVHEDDGRGRLPHGRDEGFPRMDDTQGQAALRYRHVPNDGVLAVQQDRLVELPAKVPHERAVVTEHLLAGRHPLSRGQTSGHAPHPDIQRRLDQGGLRRPDSRPGTEFPGTQPADPRQPVVPMQQANPHLQPRPALEPGS